MLYLYVVVRVLFLRLSEVVYFSFVLIRKKRYQKKGSSAEARRLLRPYFLLKGRNSLRSDSLPFFTQKARATLYASSLRRGCAVGARTAFISANTPDGSPASLEGREAERAFLRKERHAV